ncbi:MAG: outer membrane beta-barrel protein [Candidatus Zixiibacteriota bacterium]|nr:MAG: outer membrane beta-barrel protein [candidate division Zixibacteria bacterium]
MRLLRIVRGIIIKFRIIAFLIIGSFALPVSAARAEEDSLRFQISLCGGLEVTQSGLNPVYNNGCAIQAGAGLFRGVYGVRFSGIYRQSNVPGTWFGTPRFDGRAIIKGFSLALVWEPRLSPKTYPFVDVGLGLYSIDLTQSDNTYGTSLSTDQHGRLGFTLGGGLKMQTWQHVGFIAELRYISIAANQDLLVGNRISLLGILLGVTYK